MDIALDEAYAAVDDFQRELRDRGVSVIPDFVPPYGVPITSW